MKMQKRSRDVQSGGSVGGRWCVGVGWVDVNHELKLL